MPLSIKEAKNLVSILSDSEFTNSEIPGYSWVEKESNYGGIPIILALAHQLWDEFSASIHSHEGLLHENKGA